MPIFPILLLRQPQCLVHTEPEWSPPADSHGSEWYLMIILRQTCHPWGLENLKGRLHNLQLECLNSIVEDVPAQSQGKYLEAHWFESGIGLFRILASKNFQQYVIHPRAFKCSKYLPYLCSNLCGILAWVSPINEDVQFSPYEAIERTRPPQ